MRSVSIRLGRASPLASIPTSALALILPDFEYFGPLLEEIYCSSGQPSRGMRLRCFGHRYLEPTTPVSISHLNYWRADSLVARQKPREEAVDEDVCSFYSA